MSTRSAIAYTYGDGWRGRYVHSDGYPTSRGADVYAFLRANGFDAYQRLIDEHPAGFSWMPAPDEDPHDPSKHDAHLRTYSPDPAMQEQYVKISGGHGACYASWGRDETDDPKPYIEEQGKCSRDTCDPLFIEWAYVVDPSGALTVLASTASGEVEEDGGRAYVHEIMYTGRWDGPEPDWAAIENKRYGNDED